MIERVKGTRDFVPMTMAARRATERKMRDVCERFGYGEITTPALERTELFTLKSGLSIIAQMYSFKDKSDRELSLRPELTAPALRLYVNELQAMPKPLKLYYFGPCYRYEEPQSGRYREFWQLGAECIGAGAAQGNAELVALAVEIFDTVGLEDLQVRLGHLSILRSVVGSSPDVMRMIDKRDFEGLRQLETYKHLMRLLDSKNIAELPAVLEATPDIGMSNVATALEELRETLTLLEAFGVEKYELDFGIARGLDYYNGMVFEIDSPNLGAEKQVCGGGAYALAELFGGEPVSSVGFAIGFDRVMLALRRQQHRFEHRGPAIYVIYLGREPKAKAFELAALLREDGLRCDVALLDRSLSKNLKHASSVNAKLALIIGEDELGRGAALLRDLRSGEQTLVPFDEVLESVRGRVAR